MRRRCVLWASLCLQRPRTTAFCVMRWQSYCWRLNQWRSRTAQQIVCLCNWPNVFSIFQSSFRYHAFTIRKKEFNIETPVLDFKFQYRTKMDQNDEKQWAKIDAARENWILILVQLPNTISINTHTHTHIILLTIFRWKCENRFVNLNTNKNSLNWTSSFFLH